MDHIYKLIYLHCSSAVSVTMFSEINSFRSAVGNFRCGLRFRSFCYTEVWNISGYVKRYDCKIRLLGNMAELEKDVTSPDGRESVNTKIFILWKVLFSFN